MKRRCDIDCMGNDWRVLHASRMGKHCVGCRSPNDHSPQIKGGGVHVGSLYTGALLKADNQMCKPNGIKLHSEMLCIFETNPSTPRDSSDYERDYKSRPPQTQSKIIVNKNKQTGHVPGLHDGAEPAPSPSRASRHTPATSYPLRFLPKINTLRTGVEQAFALTVSLTVWSEHDIIPLCDDHAAHPPADIKKRDLEHKELSETMLIGMLKMDGIETGGDMMLCKARNDLKKRLQHALHRLG